MKFKILVVSLAILVLLLGSYFIYDKAIQPKIQNKQAEYFNMGVYQVAYEQTTQGIFFYIDNNNTIQSIPITQLCGGSNLENDSQS